MSFHVKVKSVKVAKASKHSAESYINVYDYTVTVSKMFVNLILGVM